MALFGSVVARQYISPALKESDNLASSTMLFLRWDYYTRAARTSVHPWKQGYFPRGVICLIPKSRCKGTTFFWIPQEKLVFCVQKIHFLCIFYSRNHIIGTDKLILNAHLLPIIKILQNTAGLPATYDSHTRHLRDDSTPKIGSFRPSKVSDY